MRTVREGDYLCVNRLYVFKSDIIKCTSSGYIDKGRYLDRTPLATLTRIGDFKFGDKNGKLSTNYVSMQKDMIIKHMRDSGSIYEI